MEQFNNFEECITYELKQYVKHQFDKEQEEHTKHLNNLNKVNVFIESVQDIYQVIKIDIKDNEESYLHVIDEYKNGYDNLLEYIDYLLS